LGDNWFIPPRGRPAHHSRPGSGNVGSPRPSGPPTEAKEKKGAGLAWSARSMGGTGAPPASGVYRSRGAAAPRPRKKPGFSEKPGFYVMRRASV
jgi:hypothetical protein